MENIKLPKVAIIGRPNVGKSSLFNTVIGARRAIVESAAGTTRDRLHADIRWKGKSFTIIDTAGFEEDRQGDMAALVLKQIRTGVLEADVIFFVTDGIAGIARQDRELASMLRKTSKKIYLIVNKIDNVSDAGKALEFFELGLGDPYAVSALRATGVERLCNDLVKDIEKQDISDDRGREIMKVAIVGRPNVGKSSYLNSILNEERVIVHPTAGTTRDAVDTVFNYKDKDCVLIDTAGIRHNPKLKAAADFYGSVRSKEAIERCDVAMVLIDAYEGLTKDDARIIELCIELGKALVIAVNKWDLISDVEMSQYKDQLTSDMNFIKNYPVLFISCKTLRNVRSSLDVIWSVYEKSKKIINTGKLVGILELINKSPLISNKRLKFYSLAQKSTKPPVFALGVRNAKGLNENIERFTENFLRKECDFEGTPIKIRFEKNTANHRPGQKHH